MMKKKRSSYYFVYRKGRDFCKQTFLRNKFSWLADPKTASFAEFIVAIVSLFINFAEFMK